MCVVFNMRFPLFLSSFAPFNRHFALCTSIVYPFIVFVISVQHHFFVSLSGISHHEILYVVRRLILVLSAGSSIHCRLAKYIIMCGYKTFHHLCLMKTKETPLHETPALLLISNRGQSHGTRLLRKLEGVLRSPRVAELFPREGRSANVSDLDGHQHLASVQ